MKQIRQSEIAKRAGVSLSAVSRVVNRSGYVAEDVRKRVEQIIEETGYVPTVRISPHSPPLIGIISLHGLLSPYFEKLTACLGAACEQAGYQALFTHAQILDNRALETNAKCLAGLGVRGLVICFFNDDHLEEKTRAILNKCDIPIVFIERTTDCYGFNRILVDNELGTYSAARHLIDAGHTHVLYVSRNRQSEVEQSRIAGFTKAMNEAADRTIQYQVRSCLTITPFSAYEEVKRAYEQDPEITGIVLWNDVYATGAMLYLYQNGKRVPQDVEVIGHDDVLAEHLAPPISSVHMPLEEVAASAIEIIDKGQSLNSVQPVRTVSWEPTLVLR